MMRLLRLLLIGSVLLPAALSAQDPEGVRLGLMYQPEYQPGLVVLPFQASDGAGGIASMVQGIVAQDLDYSDRFEMTLSAVEREPGVLRRRAKAVNTAAAVAWTVGRANELVGHSPSPVRSGDLMAAFGVATPSGRAETTATLLVQALNDYTGAVILVSHSQRAYFEQFMPAERVFVIPHGVDTSFFQPAPTTPSPRRIITVGSHLRDFDTLKEAIRLVWQAEPGVHFTAIGARSDKKSLFPPLEDERARFLDGIDDLSLLQCYQGASVAAFAFQEATANNAMLEAMACGLPVVATDTGGISEYIQPQTGILCPPRDPQALASALITILKDETLRRTMSDASRRRVLDLDFQAIARRMAAVYAHILGPLESTAATLPIGNS